MNPAGNSWSSAVKDSSVIRMSRSLKRYRKMIMLVEPRWATARPADPFSLHLPLESGYVDGVVSASRTDGSWISWTSALKAYPMVHPLSS